MQYNISKNIGDVVEKEQGELIADKFLIDMEDMLQSQVTEEYIHKHSIFAQFDEETTDQIKCYYARNQN